MELKITTLIENQPGQDGRLAFEHGLSLFIEFAGKRLLFDTGQTGAFADNAEKLSIDLSQLDAVILSHGHYDHSGGLARLLPLLSPGTPIYAGKEFFAAKYKKLPGDRFQYNGNPFPREIFASYPVRLHLLEAGVSALSPDILLFKNFDWSFPFEKPNPRFYTGDASGFHPDLFPDETALGLLTGRGLVFLSGCAHPGIVNIPLHGSQRRGSAPGRLPRSVYSESYGKYLSAVTQFFIKFRFPVCSGRKFLPVFFQRFQFQLRHNQLFSLSGPGQHPAEGVHNHGISGIA